MLLVSYRIAIGKLYHNFVPSGKQTYSYHIIYSFLLIGSFLVQHLVVNVGAKKGSLAAVQHLLRVYLKIFKTAISTSKLSSPWPCYAARRSSPAAPATTTTSSRQSCRYDSSTHTYVPIDLPPSAD